MIAEHLRKVHARKVGWQPTLRTVAGERDLFVSDPLDDPQYRKVVPNALLAWYRTEPSQWFKKELRKEAGDKPDAALAE